MKPVRYPDEVQPSPTTPTTPTKIPSTENKDPHKKTTMFDYSMFTKDDTVRYFMLSYCYTKWWIHDDECNAYFAKGCQKLKIYTDECKAISLKQFKDTYDGRVCIKNFFSQMTIANRANLKDTAGDPRYVIIRPVINYVTVFVILIMLIWKSHNNEVLNLVWDKNYTTVTDFSVLIKGLPDADKIDRFNDVDVRRSLDNELRRRGYNITQMSFVYDTEEFIRLKEKYSEERTEMAKEEYKDRQKAHYNENLPLISRKSLGVAMMKDLVDQQQENFDSAHPRGMTGAVIVSFMYADQAHEFLSRHKKRGRLFDLFGFGGSQNQPFEVRIPDEQTYSGARPEVYQLYAEEPAEPSDVIWENQAYSGAELFFRRAVVNILTILVFVIGFFALMSLKLAFVSFSEISNFFNFSL